MGKRQRQTPKEIRAAANDEANVRLALYHDYLRACYAHGITRLTKYIPCDPSVGRDDEGHTTWVHLSPCRDSTSETGIQFHVSVSCSSDDDCYIDRWFPTLDEAFEVYNSIKELYVVNNRYTTGVEGL